MYHLNDNVMFSHFKEDIQIFQKIVLGHVPDVFSALENEGCEYKLG